MNKSILTEMKENSGVLLNEDEISQSKQMSAESRLIGAFGRLLQELQWINEDNNRQPGGGMGYGPGYATRMANSSEIEIKTVDREALYKIAMEKLSVVEKEMKKVFKVEMAKQDAEEAEEDEE